MFRRSAGQVVPSEGKEPPTTVMTGLGAYGRMQWAISGVAASTLRISMSKSGISRGTPGSGDRPMRGAGSFRRGIPDDFCFARLPIGSLILSGRES